MTAYDLSDLLDSYGAKTCFIGCNFSSYVHNRCVVVCFDNEASKLVAIGSVPVYKSVNLYWTGFSLACCAKCKQLGHIFDVCSIGKNSGIRHKQALIVCPVFFSGKTWIQIVGSSPFYVVSSVLSGAGSFLCTKPLMSTSNPLDNSGLANHMNSLKHSIGLLSDQVSEILRKLSFVDLVLVLSPSCVLSLIIAVPLDSALSLDITIDSMVVLSLPPLPVINNTTSDLSLSSLKILITKVGGLELKMMALEILVNSVLARLDFLCSSLVWKIAMCNVREMNNLAKQNDIVHWHKNMNNLVLIFMETKLKKKIFEAPGHLVSIKLLFKNRLSVLILELYAGASSAVHFSQADVINSFIAKATNEFTFVILDSNFNKDGSHKCASFKKCFSLGLVNFLAGSSVAKMPTWENFRGVVKTIDYVFVSLNLINAILYCDVLNVSKHFNTDHHAVSVSMGLSGLLDFDIKNANEITWNKFKDAIMANTAMFFDKFAISKKCLDLDVMWDTVCKVVSLLANGVFKKKCFKDYNRMFTNELSRFHKLKVLVSRLAKTSYEINSLNPNKTSVIQVLVGSDANSDHIYFALFVFISAIEKQMKSFTVDKDHIIHSKVVLDHLVSNSSLIVDSVNVKNNVDKIIEGWTKKKVVPYNISDSWQYGKAVDLSGITNELWKHCDGFVLSMLLDLLNICLEAWVSIILKSYKWEGVLTNTKPIVLIKTAHKILSKLLFNRISLVCSVFDVLCGDNFFVLKRTTTQSSIFAIGLVVENALKKNCELWLVLQDMHKAYDSVDWHHLWNMHDDFDQGEVFSPLLWRIFYNHLLCEVKRQKSLCKYHIHFRFVAKTGKLEIHSGLTLFLAAGAFVDDTIWVGSSQAATQYILDIVSEFFSINNISINNKKTVAISINRKIYLLSEGLSKPSLAKAHSDVRFFINLVLRKAISDKQFLYLVLAVLQPIARLPSDFPNEALHHPSLYGLKSFEQVQAECKMASVLSFLNAGEILDYLYIHRSLDLQILIRLHVSPVNNYLAGVMKIFLNCDVSFENFSHTAFYFFGGTLMSLVLRDHLFYKVSCSLKKFGVAFIEQLYTKKGPVSYWFNLTCDFLVCFSPYKDFFFAGLQSLDVGSLDEIKYGTAAYFSDVNLGIGVVTQVEKLIQSYEET
ncbi:hypothetical protein G9A89_013187 [Geosiphon pyriformis]|nr:hypothetical protein G9A89_013187 [Geosiphon pyriformis]